MAVVVAELVDCHPIRTMPVILFPRSLVALLRLLRCTYTAHHPLPTPPPPPQILLAVVVVGEAIARMEEAPLAVVDGIRRRIRTLLPDPHQNPMPPERKELG